jgi:hypothetical protein
MHTRRTFLTSTVVAAASALLVGCGRSSNESAVPAAAQAPKPEPATGKRRVGRSDVSISPLVLGGNVFGWTADRDRSFEILDRFVEAGFETIDTADVYSGWVPGNKGGESETIIGEWMRSRGNRDRVIVITKLGGEMDGHKRWWVNGHPPCRCVSPLVWTPTKPFSGHPQQASGSSQRPHPDSRGTPIE